MLKSKWGKYKVKAEFPLMTKRPTTYQTAEETINEFMTSRGINKSRYFSIFKFFEDKAVSILEKGNDKPEEDE